MSILKLIKNSDLKQAIIVRIDLGMNKGKIAAQVAHASLSAYLKASHIDKKSAEKWINEGMKKIVLKVKTEEELLHYFQLAEDVHLPVSLIHDAGLTQIKKGSSTCFGIGPAGANEIDKIVGELKLL